MRDLKLGIRYADWTGCVLHFLSKNGNFEKTKQNKITTVLSHIPAAEFILIIQISEGSRDSVDHLVPTIDAYTGYQPIYLVLLERVSM